MLMADARGRARTPTPRLSGVLGSWPGKVVLFGITVALFYYLASGVRHFTWDSGRGFQPRTADLSGLACFAFGTRSPRWSCGSAAMMTGAA